MTKRSRPLFKLLLFAFAVQFAVAAPLPAQTGGLSVGKVTLIDGSIDMHAPAVRIANFDAGDLVAGSTHWMTQGIIFLETRVGFLWSPNGGSQVFEIPFDQYLNRNTHNPTDIASDGTVVGQNIFMDTLVAVPFVFTPNGGFRFLPFPPSILHPPPQPPGPAGSALAISEDGGTAVGYVQREGPFSNVPTQATSWDLTPLGLDPRVKIDTSPALPVLPPAIGAGPSSATLGFNPGLRTTIEKPAALLPTPEPWSNAFDVSDDGSVIVGDSGASPTTLQAARWTDGTFALLQSVGSASSARFTSADGMIALGTATVLGLGVIVRWDAAGLAQVTAPPTGWTVKAVRAASAAGTAAAGVLSRPSAAPPFFEDWAPFVWSLDEGIVMIPELGLEQEYDLSEALDVSDDGNLVVGSLQSSVIFQGDPPTVGFLWIRDTGVVELNELMADAGFANPDYYRVDAVSSDGSRILATGNPPGQMLNDANSVLIELVSP